MVDEHETQQQQQQQHSGFPRPSGGCPADPSPDIPVEDTPAPANRSRLTPPKAHSAHLKSVRPKHRQGCVCAESIVGELDNQTCDYSNNGERSVESCHDELLPPLCDTAARSNRECPSCHGSMRQEPCLCRGVQLDSTEADKAERTSKSTNSSLWPLVGAGDQFTASNLTLSSKYPTNIAFGDEVTGGDDEIARDQRLDIAEKATPSSSIAAGPESADTGVDLRTRTLSDGQACYPPHEASLDGIDDDGMTGWVLLTTEYRSDGSTYGSVSGEEVYASDTPTCAASTTASADSFNPVELAECVEFRAHADDRGKGKGKVSSERNTDHSEGVPGSPSGQKRGGRDEGVGGRGKRAKNNPPVDQQRDDSDGDSEKRFACPFFKNSPLEHGKCRMWSDPSLSRVKGHVLRVHLKPLQCPRCGTFRAGDDAQVKTHLRDTNCEKPATFVPIDDSTVRKGKALKRSSKKSMTWQQVYIVLFDCRQSQVPSPCSTLSAIVSENGTVVGAPSQLEMASPAQTDGRATNNISEILNDSDFQKFAQEWLTKELTQQLPQLIANKLSQVLAEYMRVIPETDNSPKTGPSATFSGPGSSMQMRTTTHRAPFPSTTSPRRPHAPAVSQSLFLPPRRFSTQSTGFFPMPVFMSTPALGAMMTTEAQHSQHSYHSGDGDSGYVGSYPLENYQDINAYPQSDAGDYYFVDMEPLE